MHVVYILQSLQDKSYYTGYTTGLEKRLGDHNDGLTPYTAGKKPFRLVWYCVFDDKLKALHFEKYLKSGSGFAFSRKRLV